MSTNEQTGNRGRPMGIPRPVRPSPGGQLRPRPDLHSRVVHLPTGPHPAVLIAVIGLGTHRREFDEGEVDLEQVLLGWEVEATTPLGSRHVVSEVYNLSSHARSKLQAMGQRWTGRPLRATSVQDLYGLIGRGALLSVEQRQGKRSTYTVILKVAPLIGSGEAPRPTNAPLLYSIHDGPSPYIPWNPRVYGKDYREVMASSREHRSEASLHKRKAGAPPSDGLNRVKPAEG